MASLLKAFKDWRYRTFYRLLLRKSELVKMGDPCLWTFSPIGLNADSVVYSGGVGGDISFERGLVERFGCRVVLCDPSPTGAGTMARPENQLPQFRFFPVGLSDRRGDLHLAKPLNREGDWWLGNDASAAGRITVPCTDLRSLMRENGHDHLDLLKLDIEGSEYAVLDDLLKQRIPVRQICVEYHNGTLPGIRRSQTIRSILKLLARGYKLIDYEGGNHTFLRAPP